ncbi:MAG: (Fe-S)-binding protein [Desulfomonilaceae bacterium]|nr:(Fe-S)-binding protein [Desulfomonilaceae bacterium]
MLLQGYSKEMFRPKCNPSFQSVHCVARLDQDISEVLPYLNTALGGGDYVPSPPSLTLRVHGKLISLHAREIFVNALNDEEEAEKILGWLKKEINDTWKHRTDIEPTYDAPEVPQMMQILKLLPRTNCLRCGEPTCTVFALRAAEGIKGPDDCPELKGDEKVRLEEYLGRFRFEV